MLPAFLFLFISALGCLYLIYACVLSVTFPENAPAKPARSPAVTILKPLRGEDVALRSNLASFCAQEYSGEVQLVFGVMDFDDPAIPIVEDLMASFPSRKIELVIDSRVHGTNLKISNLLNMMQRVRHDRIVLADSDIGAAPDYLQRIVAALEAPGVCAITCLYNGVALGGIWSRLAALAIDGHFLPNALVGLHSRLATPCFGSTIALRREQLDEIGGFAAFSDCLADDYAIGAALRQKGGSVVIPPLLVAHSCTETSLKELWNHELRWARTIRTVDPRGYAGSLITHPLPFALLALALGAQAWGAAMAIIAILCRTVLLLLTARKHGLAPPACWLTPIRDVLSFAVFIWSYRGRGVEWRGRRYVVEPGGTLGAN
ncbi:MAG: bacteriohopanetetrol glucosamine biosynthesis glycosyltransferase HpnI [Hyphomicrobiales bacterium]|nr:bacteriohopanetetrol glucosamine biosynthesis glycosyltransferase HpnI [Hyphomicrobiales bacterium]